MAKAGRALMPALLVAVFSAPAAAFDAADLARFLETGICPGCDLRRADFANIARPLAGGFSVDLSGADLRDARFTGAVFTGADFAGADLRGARLENADFGDADFRGADLRGAKLHGSVLTDANFGGADLREAALDTADFGGADFRGADLRSATGAFARFDGAIFLGAIMVGFHACYDQSFARADFRGADLREAVLCAGDWTNTRLDGADFRGADLTLAYGLTQEQLNTACGDAATKLEGLVIPACRPPPDPGRPW